MTQIGIILMAIGLALLLFLPTFRNRHARLLSQLASVAVFGAGTIGFVFSVMSPPA